MSVHVKIYVEKRKRAVDRDGEGERKSGRTRANVRERKKERNSLIREERETECLAESGRENLRQYERGKSY